MNKSIVVAVPAVIRLRLVVYKFFSCSTNIPRGLSAYKPQKLVVYCLNKPRLV